MVCFYVACNLETELFNINEHDMEGEDGLSKSNSVATVEALKEKEKGVNLGFFYVSKLFR